MDYECLFNDSSSSVDSLVDLLVWQINLMKRVCKMLGFESIEVFIEFLVKFNSEPFQDQRPGGKFINSFAACIKHLEKRFSLVFNYFHLLLSAHKHKKFK